VNSDELISRLNDVPDALWCKNIEGAEHRLTLILTDLVNAKEENER
jgi:hypothetical protein